MEGVRQQPQPYRDGDDDRPYALGDELAAVNGRLDELTRQIERLAQATHARRTSASDEQSAGRVAEALARLDRRLDEMVTDGYAGSQPEPQAGTAPRAAAPAGTARGAADWAAQISARQRALDGGTEAAPAPQRPTAPGPDLIGLEQQLRTITNQIESLQHPYKDAFAALREELAEVGRAVTEAAPSRAIAALEAQVGTLADRIDRSRQAGADGAALAGIERGLSEVRDALRGLTPAEGLDEAVRGLSSRIDQIGSSGDPVAFTQLEQSVVSLRAMMSNVASESALAQLAAEVHGLASGFERAAAESSSDALGRLDARIVALMQGGHTVPPELEQAMRSLSERIDGMTRSQGDQLSLTSLEDRIARLSDKLDTTDARLGHFPAIERGMADLLVHLEGMRGGEPRGLQPAPPAEPAVEPAPEPPRPEPARPAASPLDLIPEAPERLVVEAPPSDPFPLPLELTAPTPEPVASAPAPVLVATSDSQAVEAPAPVAPAPSAAIEPLPLQPSKPASVVAALPAVIEPPRATPKPNGRPRLEPRRPIDPDLPPDTPIEPGAGVPRHRTGSAAARIAASEAVLGKMRPVADETGGRAAAIAAARNALKSSSLDTPVKSSSAAVSNPVSLFTWFKKARNAQPAALALTTPEQAPPALTSEPAADGKMERTEPSGSRVLKHLKTLLIAASVAVIVVAAAHTGWDLLVPSDSVEFAAPIPQQAPAVSEPDEPTPEPDAVPPSPPPGPAPERNSDSSGAIGRQPTFSDPARPAAPSLPQADATNAIPRPSETRTVPTNPSAAVPTETINTALRAGITAREPAAEYEMGSRYAEGRGVPQNLQEAARWFDRAANAGFVPAQFRLAGLNEKGEGVKKDLQAARQLYLLAANKGHAKAMHNLAVLHAEGADGGPDYKVAAQWFRKAAAYGIADSQYNLAILYARGIGVEANMAESYKWFAIASGHGDEDAAKKRDEVAARLDPQTLIAAKLAVQTFVAEREPDDATSLKTPAGGWDRAPVQVAKPRSRTPAASGR